MSFVIRRTIRCSACAALLVAAASCEVSTGPDVGSGSAGFGLLVERHDLAGQRSFYRLGADGKTFTPFTGVPADARALIPSPDGKTVAYLRSVGTSIELWAMDRDGANRRAIVSGAYTVETAAWSPDGSRLALGYTTETVSVDIATVNADGTGFTDLTPDPLPGVYIDRSPAWSPDGTRLAFSSNRSGTTRLWIMNADGSNARQVLPQSFPSNEQKPVWAPDTTNFLAVVANTAAGSGIAFVRADGTDFKQVPIADGPTDPVWLPDGRLVYVAKTSGNFDLWTVDRVSGGTVQLTSRRDDDVHAAVLKDVAPFAWQGFDAAITYQINRPLVVDMTTADVLTDGRTDVLLLSPALNEIRLMKGGGNGQLQSVGALFAESDVSALRTGLITNDNAPDVVGRGDSAAYLWRGRIDGPGIATRISMAGALRDVALADLDGNGRAELVSLVEMTQGQPFRLRIHTVGASDNVVFALDLLTNRTNGKSLCAGDLTGDGRPDVVVFAGSSTLSAYLAEGKGTLDLTDPVLAGSGMSSDLAAVPYCADFDNDGHDDVALFSSGATQSVSVHRFSGTSFAAAARVAASATAIAIADVDRDGDLDIVMASSGAAAILVAKNRGGGTFDTPITYPISNVPVAVTTADLNGDGWPDVIAVDVTGALVVLLSKGRTGM
jgi:WD40 repeat protein